MIVVAGKNNIAVHGLSLAIDYFGIDNVVVVPNQNDLGIDTWQRSLKKYALERGVSIRTLDEVYTMDIDVFLSLEFDKIVCPEKLSTDSVYNIHFSYLPKYKGMYTSVWPILFGDTESGVTLHRIDRGIDTGEVLSQRTFKVSQHDRSQDLYRKYIDNSIILLNQSFKKLVAGEIKSVPQAYKESTYYSRQSIDFQNININFNSTAWQIQRYVYAFSFRPYQLIKFNNKQISDVVITDKPSRLKPGTIINETDEYITLSTIDYDIELHFDLLESLLTEIPDISVKSLEHRLHNILGINDRNEKGWSPIIVAAYHGRKDLIDFLLSKGSDINDRNYNGTTVSMYAKDYALKNTDVEFFQYVLTLGANIHLKDWQEKNLLDYITKEQAIYLGLQ